MAEPLTVEQHLESHKGRWASHAEACVHCACPFVADRFVAFEFRGSRAVALIRAQTIDDPHERSVKRCWQNNQPLSIDQHMSVREASFMPLTAEEAGMVAARWPDHNYQCYTEENFPHEHVAALQQAERRSSLKPV